MEITQSELSDIVTILIQSKMEEREYVLIKGKKYLVIHPKPLIKNRLRKRTRFSFFKVNGNKYLRRTINYVTK